MGVTPPSGEAHRPTPASRNGEPAPKPETRSRFEEAMRRMHGGDAPDHGLAGGEGLMPFAPPFVQRFLEGGDQQSENPAQGMPASPQPAAAAADGAIVSNNPADIASSHYAFADRIGLPAQIGNSETQLTMTDQRWLASYATVRHDEANGLSVEIQTRSDADADQQHREGLRSRLEARGHRVSAIQIRQA